MNSAESFSSELACRGKALTLRPSMPAVLRLPALPTLPPVFVLFLTVNPAASRAALRWARSLPTAAKGDCAADVDCDPPPVVCCVCVLLSLRSLGSVFCLSVCNFASGMISHLLGRCQTVFCVAAL